MAFIVGAIVGGGVALAGGIAKLGMARSGRGARIEEQNKAREEMEKYQDQYKELDTSNIYAGVTNQFQGMENVYEDLTVNQQQAQFEAQQGAQQRANIMQSMRGAAGGSGIASLAQAMANQGQLATQRAGASIGMQESRIQQIRAGEAGRLQLQERQGEQYAERLRLAGAETSRGLEYSKTGTLLGMSQQRLGAANQARAEAKAAQMSAVGDIAGAGLQFATGAMGMKRKPDENLPPPSDPNPVGTPSSPYGNTGAFNPYEVQMDYQQNINKPISINDPNPPALTSIGNIGTKSYNY